MYAISSIDACIASVCSGLHLSLNDVVFAADLWNLALDSTAKWHDWPMGPGTPPYFLAQLVWGSVFLEYLSHTYLIPSRLTTTISSAYERHLRKPQDESYSNQYLQELAGETTASLSSAIYMADSPSSNKEQALVIVVPVGLPPELHQCAPDYFLVVDSGARVHCLWDATCYCALSCRALSYHALFVGCNYCRLQRGPMLALCCERRKTP
jgi:hypothetical protein